MKFSGQEDVEAPIDVVFDRVTDFAAFERTAIRRGAEIERVQDAPCPTVGQSWQARFDLRGRTRDILLTLKEMDRPNALRFDAAGQGIDAVLSIDVLALAPRRTRLSVALLLEPKSLSSRLLVQSLKLARSNLNKRFSKRLADYARSMESPHKP